MACDDSRLRSSGCGEADLDIHTQDQPFPGNLVTVGVDTKLSFLSLLTFSHGRTISGRSVLLPSHTRVFQVI